MLAEAKADEQPPAGKMLLPFKAIGPEFATVLWLEGLYRQFDKRRQLASYYAGLAPTPWQSGLVDHEQGVSKAGNPRLRTAHRTRLAVAAKPAAVGAVPMIFTERVAANNGRRKKPTIVALARKLLVALWKCVTFGVVIEGAVMEQA